MFLLYLLACFREPPPLLVPGTVVSDHVLQGIALSIPLPEDAPAHIEQNRLVAVGTSPAGPCQVEVARHVASPTLEDGAAHVRKVFDTDTFSLDEARGDRWFLGHHGGGRASVHAFVPFGPDVLECWVSFLAPGDDLSVAMAWGQDVCGALVLHPSRGAPVTLTRPGEAPLVQLASRATAPLTHARLTIASGPALAHEVGVDLASSASTWLGSAPLRTVQVTAVQILRDCGDRPGCTPGYDPADPPERAVGRTFRLWFTESGQLLSVRADGDGGGLLAAQITDVLLGAAVSWPSEPIGPGAGWEVVEPTDDRVPRYRGQSPVRTAYALVGHTDGAVTVRAQKQPGAEGSYVEGTWTDDVLADRLLRVLDETIVVDGRPPVRARLEATWTGRRSL